MKLTFVFSTVDPSSMIPVRIVKTIWHFPISIQHAKWATNNSSVNWIRSAGRYIGILLHLLASFTASSNVYVHFECSSDLISIDFVLKLLSKTLFIWSICSLCLFFHAPTEINCDTKWYKLIFTSSLWHFYTLTPCFSL